MQQHQLPWVHYAAKHMSATYSRTYSRCFRLYPEYKRYRSGLPRITVQPWHSYDNRSGVPSLWLIRTRTIAGELASIVASMAAFSASDL